jgi:hypothetical protein
VLQHRSFGELLSKRKKGLPNIVRPALFLVPLSRLFSTLNSFLLLRLAGFMPY